MHIIKNTLKLSICVHTLAGFAPNTHRSSYVFRCQKIFLQYHAIFVCQKPLKTYYVIQYDLFWLASGYL